MLASRAKIKFYEAGMDLKLADNKIDCFRKFQGHILEEYESMIDEFNFKVIDATLSVQKQQKSIRSLVRQVLQGWEGLPNPEIYASRHIDKHK